MATLKAVDNGNDAFANALARRFQREHIRAVTRSYKRVVRMVMEDTQLNEHDARIWLQKSAGIELPK
jgi:hypothetical protein